ncbi:cytochrome P450 1A1-like [Tachypleus tridentatus]|uniref:cytochrome P450 1A1-like n=1 Tax=Tachypleus tridentatus TaxID=6853 RepID=UPI003FD669F9
MLSQMLYKLLNDVGWLPTALVGLLTFIVIRHFVKRMKYPPGPFPLPIVGNLLAFRDDTPQFIKIAEWKKNFGPVFTLWIGSRPVVVVDNWDAAREALIVRRNDVIGRNESIIGNMFKQENEDIMFADYSPEWEVLRKIAHSAVRKYAASEKLAELVQDVVDSCVSKMLKEKRPFDPELYTYFLTYNIIASSAFGKRYEESDQEFLNLKKPSELFLAEFSSGIPGDLIPFLRIFTIHKEWKIKKATDKYHTILKDKFLEHKGSYKSNTVRDFTDAVLAAKEEAEKEGKSSAEYLKDGNLIQVISDLFAAGTDTSQLTLRWMILLLGNYPNIQKQMYEEIESALGNRAPVQEDKHLCPYTSAFIMESLRFGTVSPFGLDHKTTVDTEIDGQKIPKDTMVIFNLWAQNRDPAYWKDPNIFNPDRFLTDNKLKNERINSYVPFGQGRRMCLGEKLAMADLFLIIVRLLQQCKITLPDGAESARLDPQPVALISCPFPFKIVVKPRDELDN